MDSFVWLALIVVLLLALLRLRTTFRQARKPDRGKEIQRRLAELRKKRDED